MLRSCGDAASRHASRSASGIAGSTSSSASVVPAPITAALRRRAARRRARRRASPRSSRPSRSSGTTSVPPWSEDPAVELLDARRPQELHASPSRARARRPRAARAASPRGRSAARARRRRSRRGSRSRSRRRSGTIGGSPSPFEPRFVRCSSGRSTNSQTISGTSAIVGMRYASSEVVRTRPVSGSSSRSSESVCPMPWMIPPSTWLEAPSGLTIRPTSWIAATRSTTTSPVSTSTATSTTWTPNVRTLIPVGFGPRAPLPRICDSSSTSTTSCSGVSARHAALLGDVLDLLARVGGRGAHGRPHRRQRRGAGRDRRVRPARRVAEHDVDVVERKPSSSAAICAIAVRVPVPMSCIAVITVARPSEPSRTQA